MPELAEVRIMSDFINAVSTNQFFERIEKSAVSKVKTDLDVFEGGVFTVSALARGKEMQLELLPLGTDDPKSLMVTLGMSGSWAMVRHDSPRKEEVLKHAHLRLTTTRGDLLILHDVRRFAKWRWGTWGADRGYCPLTEYNEFCQVVRQNYKSHKAFGSPLNELLLNQHFFNGVGNYLRAEILHRMDFSPFTIANSLDTEQLEALLKTIHFCCRDAYALGGGQLKDWINPHGTNAKDFGAWMAVYGKGKNVIDRTGRRFWYDEKWETTVPDAYRQISSKEKDEDI
jgi:endonuclease VIII-like 1